jgi:putative ABC transport system ATP-binding protein
VTELKAVDVCRYHHQGGAEVRSVDGISLTVPFGAFFTVTGPSGSGKSTLLQIFGLLDAPTSGHVYIDGADVTLLDDDARARLRRTAFGFVFQSFHLLPGLTAWENVALPRMLDGRRLRDVRDKAQELLAEVGLEHRANHRPDSLSGGEQQRVAIARALVADPDVVLADEPTGALDQESSTTVIDLLERLTTGSGRSLVLVTHDLVIAARGARQVRLRDGKVLDVVEQTASVAAVTGNQAST